MRLVDWLKHSLSALMSAPSLVRAEQLRRASALTSLILLVSFSQVSCERGAQARYAKLKHRTAQRALSPQPQTKQRSEPRLISSASFIPSDAMITRLAARAQGARWSEGHTLRVGPIPDYAPIRSIYFHRQLSGLAPEASVALEVILNGTYEVEDYDPGELEGEQVIEDTMLLWMRDYHPIYVREPSGSLKALHYLAHNPNRARYLLRGAPRVDELAHLPIIHENGNIIIAGQWVFVSERLIEDNDEGENEDHLIEAGYLPRGRAELTAMLSEALHVPQERVLMLPNMPHEATGHVDLYLMALNDHQVVIPKIVVPLERSLYDPLERQIAKDVQRFLDQRAQQVARLGLEVIRLPQLPPLRLPALDEPDGHYDVVFYSPTNGLLVNKGSEQLALLPHFDAEEVGRPELRLMSQAYERYWRKVFTALGWPSYMVNSTHLGRYLGLIHCVTASTPKLPLRDQWRAQKQLPPTKPAVSSTQARVARRVSPRLKGPLNRAVSPGVKGSQRPHIGGRAYAQSASEGALKR